MRREDLSGKSGENWLAPLPQIRLYDTTASREEVEQVVTTFWPKFADFLGVDPHHFPVKNIFVYPEEPEGFLTTMRYLYDLKDVPAYDFRKYSHRATGTYGPLRKYIAVTNSLDMPESIANGLAHAGISQITGFLSPHANVSGAVCRAAEFLYDAWSVNTEIDDLRNTLHLHPTREGYIRNYIRSLGRIPKVQGIVQEVDEKLEDWKSSEVIPGLSYVFIYLLQTQDKALFHTYLRSVPFTDDPKYIRKELERIYKTTMSQMKADASKWWYKQE